MTLYRIRRIPGITPGLAWSVTYPAQACGQSPAQSLWTESLSWFPRSDVAYCVRGGREHPTEASANDPEIISNLRCVIHPVSRASCARAFWLQRVPLALRLAVSRLR